jgi:DNA-binding IclR family transcriptional regulator
MSSSAKRALKILGTLGESGRPMGVTEIARTVDEAPGTVFRSLDALQRGGLVARHQSVARYAQGPAALAIRQRLLSMFPIRDTCLPFLRQLASLSGESTSLHVRIGWHAARVLTVPGSGEVTSTSRLAAVQVLSRGYAGLAILAHLNAADVARHFAWAAGSDAQTDRAIRRELVAIRRRGYARGLPPEAGIAFPIREQDQAFAAISIDSPDAAVMAREDRHKQKWCEVISAIENLVRANPTLADQPFQHLDPDEVLLPS